MDNPVRLTETEEIAKLAVTGMKLRDIDGRPVAIVPVEYKALDLEEFLLKPTRARSVPSFTTVESLIRYVIDHKGIATRIYVAGRGPMCQFVAIIDDDTGVNAGWREHRALHKLLMSRQWNTWSGGNKKSLSQDAFVQFIESNIADIIDPDGADLLELCRNLEITKTAQFQSMVRTQHDSVSFAYSEESKAGGKGVLEVPTTLAIAIPVFERGPKVTINAKFRFRLHEGNLMLSYELLRIDDIIDSETDAAIEAVRSETRVPLYFGVPDV